MYSMKYLKLYDIFFSYGTTFSINESCIYNDSLLLTMSTLYQQLSLKSSITVLFVCYPFNCSKDIYVLAALDFYSNGRPVVALAQSFVLVFLSDCTRFCLVVHFVWIFIMLLGSYFSMNTFIFFGNHMITFLLKLDFQLSWTLKKANMFSTIKENLYSTMFRYTHAK